MGLGDVYKRQDKGRLFVNRGKITGKPIEENWDDGKYTDDDRNRLYKGKPAEGHKQNFYRCIRDGGLTVSDVFSHVQTMNTCHLASIAARLGRKIEWDPKAEKIVGDDLAASLQARKPREGFEIPKVKACLLYTSPSPRDRTRSRMPSSA